MSGTASTQARRSRVASALVVAGIVSVIAGIAMISTPAAVVAGGAAALVVGLRWPR
ncbi:MAG TPA: hypothetical protein VN716_18835 [Vicinamibacterales bacterium]|nr:hypothetical protein [Vicinamibacterales bacterium]